MFVHKKDLPSWKVQRIGLAGEHESHMGFLNKVTVMAGRELVVSIIDDCLSCCGLEIGFIC